MCVVNNNELCIEAVCVLMFCYVLGHEVIFGMVNAFYDFVDLTNIRLHKSSIPEPLQ